MHCAAYLTGYSNIVPRQILKMTQMTTQPTTCKCASKSGPVADETVLFREKLQKLIKVAQIWNFKINYTIPYGLDDMTDPMQQDRFLIYWLKDRRLINKYLTMQTKLDGETLVYIPKSLFEDHPELFNLDPLIGYEPEPEPKEIKNEKKYNELGYELCTDGVTLVECEIAHEICWVNKNGDYIPTAFEERKAWISKIMKEIARHDGCSCSLVSRFNSSDEIKRFMSWWHPNWKIGTHWSIKDETELHIERENIKRDFPEFIKMFEEIKQEEPKVIDKKKEFEKLDAFFAERNDMTPEKRKEHMETFIKLDDKGKEKYLDDLVRERSYEAFLKKTTDWTKPYEVMLVKRKGLFTDKEIEERSGKSIDYWVQEFKKLEQRNDEREKMIKKVTDLPVLQIIDAVQLGNVPEPEPLKKRECVYKGRDADGAMIFSCKVNVVDSSPDSKLKEEEPKPEFPGLLVPKGYNGLNPFTGKPITMVQQEITKEDIEHQMIKENPVDETLIYYEPYKVEKIRVFSADGIHKRVKVIEEEDKNENDNIVIDAATLKKNVQKTIDKVYQKQAEDFMRKANEHFSYEHNLRDVFRYSCDHPVTLKKYLESKFKFYAAKSEYGAVTLISDSFFDQF
jgi:hypothetical protein